MVKTLTLATIVDVGYSVVLTLQAARLSVDITEWPCKGTGRIIHRDVSISNMSKVQLVLQRSVAGRRLVQERHGASNDVCSTLHIHVLPGPPDFINHSLYV